MCVLVVAMYLYKVRNQRYYGTCIFCALLSRHLQLCFSEFVCRQELPGEGDWEISERNLGIISYSWEMSFAGLLWTDICKIAVAAISVYSFWSRFHACVYLLIRADLLGVFISLLIFKLVTCVLFWTFCDHTLIMLKVITELPLAPADLGIWLLVMNAYHASFCGEDGYWGFLPH